MSDRSKALVRALLYPAQFALDPRDANDRVIEEVVDRGCLDGSPAEYARAIRDALASGQSLEKLIPQDHDEETIRRYLVELARRIDRRLGRCPD